MVEESRICLGGVGSEGGRGCVFLMDEGGDLIP